MTVEERIEAADRRKKEGNALFAEEKLPEAMQQYEMVLNAIFTLIHSTSLIFFYTRNSVAGWYTCSFGCLIRVSGTHFS